MDNNRICHRLLFHERGKQNLCSHFSCQGSYYGCTHAWTELHTEVMSWISGTYAWALSEANWTTVRDLYYLPLFVNCRSAVTMRALTWVVFVPGFLSRQRCTLAVAFHRSMWQQAGHIAWHKNIRRRSVSMKYLSTFCLKKLLSSTGLAVVF